MALQGRALVRTHVLGLIPTLEGDTDSHEFFSSLHSLLWHIPQRVNVKKGVAGGGWRRLEEAEQALYHRV